MALSQKRNIPVLSRSRPNTLQLGRGARNTFGKAAVEHSAAFKQTEGYAAPHSQHSLEKLVLTIILFPAVLFPDASGVLEIKT